MCTRNNSSSPRVTHILCLSIVNHISTQRHRCLFFHICHPLFQQKHQWDSISLKKQQRCYTNIRILDFFQVANTFSDILQILILLHSYLHQKSSPREIAKFMHMQATLVLSAAWPMANRRCCLWCKAFLFQSWLKCKK